MRASLLERPGPAPPPPIAASPLSPPSLGAETRVSDGQTPVGVVGVLALAVLLLLSPSPAGTPGPGQSLLHAGVLAFPYSYAAPVVPSSVGAQGIQGTIPGLPVGPPPGIVAGPVGHLGPTSEPSSGYFQRTAVVAEYQIWNGTLTPLAESVSVFAHISLRNATYGWYANATTNSHGFANVSVWAGWYDVTVTQPTGLVNLSEQQNVAASSLRVRWLLPTSLTSTNIHNCGALQATCTRTVYAHIFGMWQLTALPQWTVFLLNASNGNAQLGSAVTGSNGTAVFTQVNSVYSYGISTNGYSQAATGVVWGTSNDSEGPFVGSTLVNANAYASRYTTFSGSVNGTSPPAIGFSWTLAANTVLTGGTLFLGMHWHPTSFTLKFNGVRVYVDSDQGDPTTAGLAFANCTFVFLAQSALFAPQGSAFFYLNHTTVLGSAIPSKSTSHLNFPVTAASWSIIDVTNVTLANPALISGTWTSDRLEWNGTTVVANSAAFFNALNVTHTAIWGLYSLGQIGYWSENWDRDQFVNARAGLTNSQSGAAFGGTLTLTNSTSVNSTVIGYANATTLWGDDLSIAYSLAGNFAGFSGNWGNVSRSRLTFGLAPGQNYTQLYLSRPAGGPNSGPFPGYAVGFRVPNSVNFSQSYVNNSGFPMINMSMSGVTNVAFRCFDSVWNITRTPAQLIANYTVAGQTILKGGGMGIESATNALYVNYSVLNTSNGWFSGAYGAFVHDLWPWTIVYNGYSDGVQMFYVPDIGHPSVNRTYSFQNDSWTYEIFNRTVWGDATTGVAWFWPEAQEIIQDTQTNNFGGPQNGHIVFSHNTVDPLIEGAGQLPPMGMELSQRNVNTTISYDLFRNSPSYVLGPVFAHPYAADIQAEGGVETISHNWFLNLNNVSVAVAATNLQGASDGWRPTIRMSANHYSFAPRPGQSFVDPAGPYQASESPPSPVDFLGIPSTATVGYELPIGANVTGPTSDGAPYIFNTTVLQSDPAYQSRYSNEWPHAWSWAIAPSVNVSSGAPVVSYVGIGGTQPRFLWAGHSYTLSVEPNATQLTADASSAPAVTALFSETPGMTYNVQAWNTLTSVTFASQLLTANATGALAFTYLPSQMPLTATIQVFPASAASPAPPLSGGTLWTVALLVAAVPTLFVVLAVAYRSSQEET